MESTVVGYRVVRGPDWRWNDQDGGEGNLGTVVEVGKKGSSTSPEKTVIVQWDNGSRTNYRMGYHNAYDLLIYDNATVGIQHVNILCDACNKQGFMGMRYNCTQCQDFDLCASCYHSDKHDLSHHFLLYITPSSVGVKLPPRSSAIKIGYRGLVPGAKVMRGPDWDWGNQDGGDGKIGRIKDIRGWDSESDRSVANVQWSNGNTNVYRVGHKGKVDLRCLDSVKGGTYYKDHLWKLGQKVAKNSVSAYGKKWSFVHGEKVKVNLDVAVLKIMQGDHGGWNAKMEEYVGQEGYVHRITEKGDIRVQYSDGIKWTFHPGALTKVTTFSVDDNVRITSDIEKLRKLQLGHGEWHEDMKMALGKVGRVIKIYKDGDLRVCVNGQSWTYHCECVTAVESSQDVNVTVAAEASSSQQQQQDPSGNVQRLKDRIRVLRKGEDCLDKLVTAAARGDVSVVGDLVLKRPGWVNEPSSNKTALQVAAHQGHVDVVKILVQAGANLSIADQEGDTALHYAVFGNQPGIVRYLLEHGAEVNLVNKGQCSSLHVAVNKSYMQCVEELIKKECNVNLQDCCGDTALHDAIAKDNTEAIDILTNIANAEFTLANRRGFNVLQHAALKGNKRATEKLVRAARQLVNRKKDDGFSALHLASLNGHRDVVEVLLTTGQADINIRNNRLQTPIHLAVSQGHVPVVELLVSRGADLLASDEDGDTCLHVALMKPVVSPGGENLPVIRGIQATLGVSIRPGVALACFLIQEGADPSYLNTQSKSALDLVKEKRSISALKFFMEHRRQPGRRIAVPNDTSSHVIEDANITDESDAIQQPQLVMSTSVSTTTCKLCHKMADCCLKPCKHITCCMECSQLFALCPVCKGTIESREKIETTDQSKCSLCKTNVADVTLLPCRHRAACADCFQKMSVCAVCSEPIIEVITAGSAKAVAGVSANSLSKSLSKDKEKISKITTSNDKGRQMECAICMERESSVVFLCGHTTCGTCAKPLRVCHICRKPITKKVNLFL
ncbi:E3 ubiquitin-protein ligase MIB2-like isoform X1 [Apostichopus japonicus]|uniref:E3 ubiquitin-protein ligase MIB2-like isoform X1 n=1 Tax=Stichopus japonicus TaxID=307972 RepID=UPI003AB7276F